MLFNFLVLFSCVGLKYPFDYKNEINGSTLKNEIKKTEILFHHEMLQNAFYAFLEICEKRRVISRAQELHPYIEDLAEHASIAWRFKEI